MIAGPIGTLGRYHLFEEIGQGGMAKVYLARRAGAKELCVLKQLHVDLENNPTASKRFQREAHIVSHLAHPNIATVVGAGMEGSSFCIAMELIRGQTIEAALVEMWRENRALPMPMTMSIVLDVLGAAAYAHAATDDRGAPLHIVHRDLSPRNIMVSFTGQTKVIDFGVAHGRIDGFQTAPGMMVGTLRYMSPEQARAEKIDARSDLYTLGIVLYEMLSGRPCITDKKAVDVLNRVINEPLPPLRSIAPDVSRNLEAVVAKATDKERRRRYQSAGQMQKALAQVADDVGRASNEEIGAFLRTLFPDHARQTAAWNIEDIEDSLDPPTLSEAVPLESYPTFPEVMMATQDIPTTEDLAAVNDTIPPPAPTRRKSSVRRPGSRIRVDEIEHQLKRWRTAALLLMVALTAAMAVVTWLLVRAR